LYCLAKLPSPRDGRYASRDVVPLAWSYRVSDQQEIIDAGVTRWLEIFQADEARHSLHSLL
jgi:hypothetical protein